MTLNLDNFMKYVPERVINDFNYNTYIVVGDPQNKSVIEFTRSTWSKKCLD